MYSLNTFFFYNLVTLESGLKNMEGATHQTKESLTYLLDFCDYSMAIEVLQGSLA